MKNRPRVFMHGDTRLADPDPTKTPAEVKDFYASQYPELTTATYSFELKDGKDVYSFKKSLGTKG